MSDNSIPEGAGTGATPPPSPSAVPPQPHRAAPSVPPAAPSAPTYAYQPPPPTAAYTPPPAAAPHQGHGLVAYPGQAAPVGYPNQAAPVGYPGQAAPVDPAVVYAPPSAPGYATPGYAGPVYAAPAYPARPNSGIAVAAMICGIVGFLFGWATALILVPIIVSIAAVVLGHVALGQLKNNPGLGGKGMAVTGLILGYVPIAIALIVAIFAVFAFVTVGAFTLPFVFSS